MSIFDGKDQFIIQSEIEDFKDAACILDENMRILAYFRHEHNWKEPSGSEENLRRYRQSDNHVQWRTTDISFETVDGKLGGEINEFPPKLFSKRLIRTFEIHDHKKEIQAVVKEKPKFIGSDWILENPKNEVLATTKGNWKKKDYEILSKEKKPIAIVQKAPMLSKDSYKVDIIDPEVELFLVLCYSIVLDLAKNSLRLSKLTVKLTDYLLSTEKVLYQGKAKKDTEYLITNRRVLIYPSPYAEKNRPKIINLYEVNGEIEMTNTGNLYIPTPHRNRFGGGPYGEEANIEQGNNPDIKGIEEPHKAYDIIIEAIATGKATKWK